MPRPFTPKVVTANHLVDGDVIYLTSAGDWSRNLEDSAVFAEQEEAEQKLAEASKQVEILVGPYLADVVVEDGTPKPAHFREAFRAKGPSNYFHGKQEHA